MMVSFIRLHRYWVFCVVFCVGVQISSSDDQKANGSPLFFELVVGARLRIMRLVVAYHLLMGVF